MKQIDFDTVHRLASVGSLLEPLRRAFVSQSVSPERGQYDLGALDPPHTLLLMPAWRPAGDIGVKIVTVFRQRRSGTAVGERRLRAPFGANRASSSMDDGRALTLIRTAAVSALAADLLAPAAPEVLLMVGTGALSRYLVEGHLAVRKYRSVLIWGRDPQKAAAAVEISVLADGP